MTPRLAILYSAAAASALAAERRPVDLDGSRHLEAVGIPASPSSFFDWYGASRFPTPSTALPSLPYEQLLETSRSASQDETGAVISKCMPVGNSSQNILGCLLDCQVCADLDSSTGKVVASNATCVEASGKRAFVTGGTNLTKTVYAAFAKMTESTLGANATHADCNCQLLELQGPLGCTYRMAGCSYIALPADGSPALLSRATAWNHADLAGPSGRSPGYADPLAGVNISTPSGAFEAYALATKALQARPDAGVCARPASVPPLVVVPGLTSSAIEYELHDSPPPWYAFWCSRTTQGWQPLWPLADLSLNFSSKITSHPLEFLCWVSNVQVAFDPATKAFAPWRKGEKTRLVDFGGVKGIPGLLEVMAFMQAAGWELGTDLGGSGQQRDAAANLYAAPFDWRVPSAAQDQFFDDTKALVEHAFAAHGKKVVLWAVSFGPQYTLSFLHRMSQAWKEEHLAAFVASSPVWSGAPAAMAAYLSGIISEGGANVTNGLVKQLARASPSLVWAFPRAGTNRTVSWTRDDVLVATQGRNYTAFDLGELLGKLGVSDTAAAEYDYLAHEPDLGGFAPPGVDTLVTYGVGSPTTSSLAFADHDVSRHLQPPIAVAHEDGDGLVPKRASLRGHGWAGAQAALHKSLAHREYPHQPHADCFAQPKVISGPSTRALGAGAPPPPENATGGCFRGVLQYVMQYA